MYYSLYISDIASCERALLCLTTSIPRPNRSLLIQARLQPTHKRVPNSTRLWQAKEATEELYFFRTRWAESQKRHAFEPQFIGRASPYILNWRCEENLSRNSLKILQNFGTLCSKCTPSSFAEAIYANTRQDHEISRVDYNICQISIIQLSAVSDVTNQIMISWIGGIKTGLPTGSRALALYPGYARPTFSSLNLKNKPDTRDRVLYAGRRGIWETAAEI